MSKHKSPSREKYDQNHPTVSFRISKELNDRLRAVKEAEGKSTTEILKIGVGLLEVKNDKEQAVRREGNRQGYKAAHDLYSVVYPCANCGKLITVTSPNEKAAIKSLMKNAGWRHGDCNQA